MSGEDGYGWDAVQEQLALMRQAELQKQQAQTRSNNSSEYYSWGWHQQTNASQPSEAMTSGFQATSGAYVAQQVAYQPWDPVDQAAHAMPPFARDSGTWPPRTDATNSTTVRSSLYGPSTGHAQTQAASSTTPSIGPSVLPTTAASGRAGKSRDTDNKLAPIPVGQEPREQKIATALRCLTPTVGNQRM